MPKTAFCQNGGVFDTQNGLLVPFLSKRPPFATPCFWRFTALNDLFWRQKGPLDVFYFTMSRAIFDDFVLQLFYKWRFLTLFWTPKMTNLPLNWLFWRSKYVRKRKCFFCVFWHFWNGHKKANFEWVFTFLALFVTPKCPEAPRIDQKRALYVSWVGFLALFGILATFGYPRCRFAWPKRSHFFVENHRMPFWRIENPT